MLWLFVWLRSVKPDEVHHTEPDNEELSLVAEGKLKIFQIDEDGTIQTYDHEQEEPDDAWQELVHKF